MNYWERWIGDWKRKTAHLNAEQKGIYGELLDHCYATQKPLPLEIEHVCRIAGARTPTECKAVEIILREFFFRTEDGYLNKRVQEEISKRLAYIGAQTERANKRWGKREGSTATPLAAGKPNGKWWMTHEGIDEKGRELGIAARPGESYPEYKSRLFDTINAERGQEQ